MMRIRPLQELISIAWQQRHTPTVFVKRFNHRKATEKSVHQISLFDFHSFPFLDAMRVVDS
jgi:hypothetical protein